MTSLVPTWVYVLQTESTSWWAKGIFPYAVLLSVSVKLTKVDLALEFYQSLFPYCPFSLNHYCSIRNHSSSQHRIYLTSKGFPISCSLSLFLIAFSLMKFLLHNHSYNLTMCIDLILCWHLSKMVPKCFILSGKTTIYLNCILVLSTSNALFGNKRSFCCYVAINQNFRLNDLIKVNSNSLCRSVDSRFL